MHDHKWQRILWFLLHILSLNFRLENARIYDTFLVNMLYVLNKRSYVLLYKITKALFASNPYSSRKQLVEFLIYYRNMVRCSNHRSNLISACNLVRFYESFRAICKDASRLSEGGCHDTAVPVSKSRLVIVMNGDGGECSDTTDTHCILQAPCKVSDSGDGFSTFVWGPAMWFYIHYLSFHSGHMTWEERRGIIRNIGSILPCGACRDNFEKNYDETISLFDKGEQGAYEEENFPHFCYELHQTVSRCLGKKEPPPSFAEVEAMYTQRPLEICLHIKKRSNS